MEEDVKAIDFKDIGTAVKTYVKKRDGLRAWKAKRDAEELRRKEELTRIEVWLLTKAKAMGVDSFKTKFGTAYRKTMDHFRIIDWEAFTKYVKDTDNFQLFEKRVAKLATREILDTTGELPNGIDNFPEDVINVLRPKSTGKEG